MYDAWARTQKLANGVIQREIGYRPDTYRPWTQHITASETSLQSLSFNFDALGRLTAYDDLSHAVGLDDYDYDPLNRIKQVSGTYQQTYDYDDFGNLTLHRDLIYWYGRESEPFHAPDRVETSGDEPSTLAWFDYDLNGNLIAKTFVASEYPVSYTYDTESRLTQAISGSETTTFVYDGDGQLVRRNSSAGETFYLGDYYEISKTGGWSKNTAIFGEDGTMQRWPDMVTGTNDILYLVWAQDNGEDVDEVRFASRSSINGDWSDPESLGWTDSNNGDVHPVIALNPVTQEIFVAWQEQNQQGYIEVLVRKRGAGGWEDTTIEAMSHAQGGDPRPALAAAPDGRMYLAWASWHDDLDRTVIHVRQLDSLQPDYLASSTYGNDQHSPALVSDNQGTIYLAYNETRIFETYDLFVARLVGGNWDEPELVDSGIGYPVLAVDKWHVPYIAEGNYLWKWNDVSQIWELASSSCASGQGTDLAIDGDVVYFVAASELDDGPDYLCCNGSSIREYDIWTSHNPSVAVQSGNIVVVWDAERKDVSGQRLFISTFRPDDIVTKRYFAGSQQLALRANGELYYTLPDPTGASLLLTDSAGNEAGYILYDPYGGVLTSTIPATLTAALAVQGSVGDPDTGLVHLGNGRYYDPSMGRPLQPNPVGGPPIVPQALNRYAATPVGQPGVAEGAGSIGFDRGSSLVDLTLNPAASTPSTRGCLANPLCSESGSGGTGYLIGQQSDKLFRSLARPRHTGWSTVVFGSGIQGDRVWRLHASELAELKTWEFYDDLRISSVIPETAPLLPGSYTRVSKLGLNNALPFAVDIGFQLWQDWDNPYLTPRDKTGRAIISGVVGSIGGGIAYGAAWIIVGATPPSWLLLGTGIVVGILFENPVSTAINETVFPAERDLRPLE